MVDKRKGPKSNAWPTGAPIQPFRSAPSLNPRHTYTSWGVEILTVLGQTRCKKGRRDGSSERGALLFILPDQ
jgi:hypothetical protein